MSLPKLIVFDLDNTLWTPELYQLRKLQRANQVPTAGKDVKLMEGSSKVIEEYIPKLKEQGVQFGVASRTKSVEWAHALLGQFQLRETFTYIEIFPGNKRKHFQNIKEQSGIDYKDMLFFDDARDGKFGNCEIVSELGVLSVHCPNGLDSLNVFTSALEKYRVWDKSANTIVEWDGRVTNTAATPTERISGTIKMVNPAKRFGFIRYREGNARDVFFHFRNLSEDTRIVEESDEVSFNIRKDSKNGKDMATNIQVEKKMDTECVSMRCFSMNNPFAALLANGYKTLETRNGTMFTQYIEGTQMLLHVGNRIYPDGDKHIEVMKSGGLSDEEIKKLKTMPQGFGKGHAVAILEIGKTYETTTKKRCDPDFQRNVAAFGEDSGRIVTEIRRVAYLKKPVRVQGEPGVFKVSIDPDVIPDGWSVPSKGPANRLVASISG
jgi:magnesium-dependent phosphatase 1